MSQARQSIRFDQFYAEVYREEHQNPVNIALHAGGTALSLMLLAAAAAGLISPWWVLAYPLVHVGPGLIGHRLFERNPEVGDTRLGRTDFPLYWFIAANHRLTFRLLTGRRP
jgi:hypothetical protein